MSFNTSAARTKILKISQFCRSIAFYLLWLAFVIATIGWRFHTIISPQFENKTFENETTVYLKRGLALADGPFSFTAWFAAPLYSWLHALLASVIDDALKVAILAGQINTLALLIAVYAISRQAALSRGLTLALTTLFGAALALSPSDHWSAEFNMVCALTLGALALQTLRFKTRWLEEPKRMRTAQLTTVGLIIATATFVIAQSYFSLEARAQDRKPNHIADLIAMRALPTIERKRIFAIDSEAFTILSNSDWSTPLCLGEARAACSAKPSMQQQLELANAPNLVLVDSALQARIANAPSHWREEWLGFLAEPARFGFEEVRIPCSDDRLLVRSLSLSFEKIDEPMRAAAHDVLHCNAWR